MHQPAHELLGAHVSVQGGMATAPVRGRKIGATALQVFTKTPSQWREPILPIDAQTAFRREFERSGIARIVSHDSYLINLASPDPVLRTRSEASFRAELERCDALGIPHVVSHPGNYLDSR
jgi:deoxyribonuclease IV